MASHPIGITVGVMQILTVCQRPFLFSPRVLSFTLTHVFFFPLSSNVTFTAADIFSKSFHLLSLEIWFYHLNTIQWTSIYFGSGGQTVAWAGMSITYIRGIFNLINWCIFWIMYVCYFNHWNNSLIWIMLHFAIFLNTRRADTALWTSVRTWTSVLWAFFHPVFPPPGCGVSHGQTRTHLLWLCPQLSWPTSSPINHSIKACSSSHLAPGCCWVLVVFLTGLLRVGCVFTFWFRSVFGFVFFNMVFGPLA